MQSYRRAVLTVFVSLFACLTVLGGSAAARATTIDGTYDSTFSAGTGFGPAGVATVNGMLQVGTDILVYGTFSTFNGQPAGGIVMLHADGSRDTTFNPSGGGFVAASGLTPQVSKVVQQSTGKFVVFGNFLSSYDDGSSHAISDKIMARLTSTGLFDSTFNSGGTGFSDTQQYVTVQFSGAAIQPDDQLIVSGTFNHYTDSAGTHSVVATVRLSADGLLDTSFVTNYDYSLGTMIVQSTGTIIEAGGLASHFGSPAQSTGYLTRMTASGAVDTSWRYGTGFSGSNGTLGVFIAAPNGQFLADANAFTSYYDGQSHTINHLVRLNADGSLDTTFNQNGTGFATSAIVADIAVQSNGKIVVTGYFSSYNDGTPHTVNNIVRLNSDGTVDTSFNPGGTGFSAYATKILITSAGILVSRNSSGSWTYNDGTAHSDPGGLIRISTSTTNSGSGGGTGGGGSGSGTAGGGSSVGLANSTLTLTPMFRVGDRLPNASVALNGTGLAPNSAWHAVIHSTPQTFASGTTDASGNFSNTGQLPSNLETGQHQIILYGTTPSGDTWTRVVYVNVDGNSVVTAVWAADSLAETGTDVMLPLGIAAVTLLGGTLVLLARRRSRTSR